MNGSLSRAQLADVVRSIDRESLESVVMSLADMFGTAAVIRAVGEVSDGTADTCLSSVAERTESALYMDDDGLRHMSACDDYGDPVDPGEYATDMMRQCIRDEFADEVGELVRKGKSSEACEVVRRIAEGLRMSDSTLVRSAPESAEELVYHLEWCADHGKPMAGFS